MLELDDKVYIFEFKYYKCLPGADEAKERSLSDAALVEAIMT